MGGSIRDLPIGSDRWKQLSFGLIPLIMTLVVFFPVLQYGFVWDDSIYLQVQLPAYQSFWDAFFPGSQVQLEVYYRPIVILSFLVDRALWGSDPFGYHLTGLLLHLACTWMVFLTVARLLKEQDRIPWGLHGSFRLFWASPHSYRVGGMDVGKNGCYGRPLYAGLHFLPGPKRVK